MKTQAALDYFGAGLKPHKVRSRLADVAKVTRQTVLRWIATGYIPLQKARLLQAKSGGAVKVDLTAYPEEKPL
jgi:hypothetical protein